MPPSISLTLDDEFVLCAQIRKMEALPLSDIQEYLLFHLKEQRKIQEEHYRARLRVLGNRVPPLGLLEEMNREKESFNKAQDILADKISECERESLLEFVREVVRQNIFKRKIIQSLNIEFTPTSMKFLDNTELTETDSK
jgi:hypothetical protein